MNWSNKATDGSSHARPSAQVAAAVTIAALAGAALAAAAGAADGPPLLLRDVTSLTGITFQHTDGGSGRRYIVETVTAGLALFDYDGDGDIDIYFLNGAPLRETEVDVPPGNALYRNDGNFTFTDVTDHSGVGDQGYGAGVAVADYDNDGAPDIYVNNFGTNVMYHNNGDGTFSDTTNMTGTAGDAKKLGAGACFFDAEGDGDLDLYVASYLDFEYETHVHNIWLGYHVYPGPEHYAPVPDSFYRNNGDGTFTDATDESGIGGSAGRGMGVIAVDYDNDEDTDVFVANDTMPNFLFQNDGTGKFTDVGALAGIAYDLYGQVQGSMSVDCCDYNHDGLLDFYLTSYQRQSAVLYENLGDGLFEDVTVTTRAGEGTVQHVTWGAGFADFDNDADRDIFVACGHIYDNVDLFSDATSYAVRNMVLMNTGDKFVNVSDRVGDGLLPCYSSRGAAFDDLDDDGRTDAVILNSRSQPTIIRNASPANHHWLQIRLRGQSANRDGVGARVKVVTGNVTQIDEVCSGRGYQSHYATRLHFGLGERERVDRVEVRWIGGGVDILKNVAADQLLTITQDSSPAAR